MLLLLNVLNARNHSPAGEWIAVETDEGFIVKCGDDILHSVHSAKPRLFKSLDTVHRKMREELGITEFKVVALKNAA